MAAQVAPITVEQFLNFKAPPGFRAELLHGEIILSPDPKLLHHDVVMNIYKALDRQIGPHGKVGSRCNIAFPVEHYMPSPDVFVLSLAEWSQARAESRYPLEEILLVIDIVSRSNTEQNVLDKTALYLRNKAYAVWVVDPEEQHTDVYWPGQEKPVRYGRSRFLYPGN